MGDHDHCLFVFQQIGNGLFNRRREDYYGPLLKEHGFSLEPENHEYGSMGLCWRLSPSLGQGTYWTYGQKDLFDIKIHNFLFYRDSFLKFSFPECLSITRYDSISGEELSPYRRLKAGCIKTFMGGEEPYKVLIHRNSPIRSVGIEIMPAFKRYGFLHWTDIRAGGLFQCQPVC